MTLTVAAKKEVKSGEIPRVRGNLVDQESKRKHQRITRSTNLTEMTANIKGESKIILGHRPLQHRLPHPAPEKRKRVRKKEKMSLNLTMR